MTYEATRTQRWTGKVLGKVLPWWSTFYRYRIAYADPASDPGRPEYDHHNIMAFWHEYLGVMVPKWGNCPVTMLVSQHRDAEWLNQTAESMGYGIVRGSSTRGGATALRQLKRFAKQSSVAITPDGPQGPRREMAIGPVYLASMLQMPLVPVGVGIDRVWRLKTWDSFAMPKPFAKIRVIFGPRLTIPAGLDKDGLEHYRGLCQASIAAMTEVAESWARGTTVLEGHPLRIHWRRKKVYANADAYRTNCAAQRAADKRDKTIIESSIAPWTTDALDSQPLQHEPQDLHADPERENQAA